MNKYKVIALSVAGLGKKIHRSGDVVTESNFEKGKIEALVKGKFLEPIEDKKEKKEESKKEESKK